MLRVIWLGALTFLLGCATLGAGRAIPTDRFNDCAALDESFLAWKAVGYVGAGVAAAGGTGGALITGLVENDQDWMIGLSVTGAVGAIVAGLGTWMASEYAERWAQQCGINLVPAVPEPEPSTAVATEPTEEVVSEAAEVAESTDVESTAEIESSSSELPVSTDP